MQSGSRNQRFGLSSYMVVITATIIGCAPSAKELMQGTFALDSPVVVEYQPDGSRIFKTRNMVLFADYGKSQLSSLVMVVALSGEPTKDDSSNGIGGLVKFRSIDNLWHFEANRSLILTVQGEKHDLGPCAYQQDTLQRGAKIEDLTVVVPQDLVKRMASVDMVQGQLGEVQFELAGEQLMPIRALVDTIRTQ
jgi:hypothetical protein